MGLHLCIHDLVVINQHIVAIKKDLIILQKPIEFSMPHRDFFLFAESHGLFDVEQDLLHIGIKIMSQISSYIIMDWHDFYHLSSLAVGANGAFSKKFPSVSAW